MKRFFTGLTDPGLLRAVNQDDYFIDPQGRFFVVADGMGGHAGGQEASRLATEAIQTCLSESWDSEEESSVLLETAFLKANQEILQDPNQAPRAIGYGHYRRGGDAAAGSDLVRSHRRLPPLSSPRRKASANHRRSHLGS